MAGETFLSLFDKFCSAAAGSKQNKNKIQERKTKKSLCL
jgi:hypothetical protein